MEKKFKKILLCLKFVYIVLFIVILELVPRKYLGYQLNSVELRKTRYFEMDKVKIWNSKFVEEKKAYFEYWPIKLETFNDTDIYPRYLFKKNIKMTLKNDTLVPAGPKDTIYWSSNSFGFRSQEFTQEKPPEMLRIVALGASTTEGSQSDTETYPYFLEKLLQQYGYNIQVINAGFHGFGIDDLQTIFIEKIVPIKPDMVIFYEVSNNTNPQEWLKEKWSSWESWYQGYPQWFGLLWRYSMLFRIIAQGLGYENKPPPIVSHTFDTSSSKLSLQYYRQSLEKIIDAAEENSITFILTSFVTVVNKNIEVDVKTQSFLWRDIYLKWYPFSPEEIEKIYKKYNEAIRDLAQNKHTELIDLDSIYPKETKYFIDHIHFTPEGNQVFAKIIADFLVREELLHQ